MSLIQEALKRQQTKESAGIPLPPVTPERNDSPETTESGASVAHPLHVLPLAVLLILLIAVLTGIGIYLIKPHTFFSGRTQLPAATPSVLPAPAPEPVAITELSTPEVQPETNTEPAEPRAEPLKKEEPAAQPEWPELSLTGIARRNNQSIAIINGKMLSAGRTVEGVTVREVNNTGVVVEYRGERRTLYINE